MSLQSGRQKIPNVWIVPDFEYYQGCEISWECRDCIILSDEEYLEKLWSRLSDEMQLKEGGL